MKIEFPLDFEVWKSFKDWNALGRVVERGQKSKIKTQDGVALFHLEQTKRLTVFIPSEFAGAEMPDFEDYDDHDPINFDWGVVQ